MVAIVAHQQRALCTGGCGRRPFLGSMCSVCRYRESCTTTRHGPPPCGYDGGEPRPEVEDRVQQLAAAYEPALAHPRADTRWDGPSWVELLPWPGEPIDLE